MEDRSGSWETSWEAVIQVKDDGGPGGGTSKRWKDMEGFGIFWEVEQKVLKNGLEEWSEGSG